MPYHIRVTPQPAQIVSTPSWFDDRVQIDTDSLTIPRGVYLTATTDLAERLEKRVAVLSERADSVSTAQMQRTVQVLTKLQEFLTAQSAAV